MSQPNICTIPYQLIGDEMKRHKWENGRQVPYPLETETVEIHEDFTILDLYQHLEVIYGDSYDCITIQFPCSVPSQVAPTSEWTKLVGCSGLAKCWPTENNHTLKPMQVIAIQKRYFSRHTKSHSPEHIRERMEPEVWIRPCWQEFQDIVIAHFVKKHQIKEPATPPDASRPPVSLLEEPFVDPHPGQDEDLLMSIIETPPWIYLKHASESPFTEFDISTTNSEFDEDQQPDTEDQAIQAFYVHGEPGTENEPLPGFYVNGPPGTGKSQMLLYLIHSLMRRLEKVVILYVLKKKPVITILIDHSNLSSPITVRCHDSSLGETLYTKGFRVIRIVDSKNPLKNEQMQNFFTVYAAAPSKFDKHMRELQASSLTAKQSTLAATTIVNLHPLVVTLLGTHGYLTDGPNASSGEGQLSRITSPRFGMSPELADTVDIQGISVQAGSHHERVQTPSTTALQAIASNSPGNGVTIWLNVIEVFGLSPRALSADLNTVFQRLSEVFGLEGFNPSAKYANRVMDSLAAAQYSDRPMSLFASRFQAAMTRIRIEGFANDFEKNQKSEVIRSFQLEHDVNSELFWSHSRFTVFSATPNLFSSFKCTFPIINHRPLLSSQLIQADTLTNNVLYYEMIFDPRKKTQETPWKGINSFIFFLVEDSILLFTFNNAVNSSPKPVDNELIEALKNKLVNQVHQERVAMAREVNQPVPTHPPAVEVFFIWIVRPESVESYTSGSTPKTQKAIDLNCKIGVVSVADLLLNECSTKTTMSSNARQLSNGTWTPDSPQFKKCFMMARDHRFDPNATVEMEQLVSVDQKTTNHQEPEDTDGSTNEGLDCMWRDSEEDDTEEDLPSSPKKIPRRKRKS
ncbi:hypothetical protein BLNAU_16443 [Blattamonas nauphoetae]|uniref:DNA2/NAM7 helicase helicase domain-containing protein n=1 Tax=Blattamonas nauphoetae TaxID=2049346 RepID=A0ABQ9XCN8_9EUKA|nr:hypothetical protein BLNAU_16443 [Blattamonas nauphoetae]